MIIMHTSQKRPKNFVALRNSNVTNVHPMLLNRIAGEV